MNDLLPLADFLMIEVTTFMLVVTRVAGIVIFGPLYSSNSLPGSFRFYLTFAISLMIVPTLTVNTIPVFAAIDMVVLLLGEILIGLVLGTFLQMIFQALQLAGQTAGTQLGLALANVVNPQFDEQTSTTAVVYVTVASLAFVGIGGDRELVGALLETFSALPLGHVWYHDSMYGLTLQLFQESMIFSIRVVAPITVAMLLTEVSMGFIGRTVPQLNVLSIGFAIRIMIGLLITMTSLLAATEVFMDYISVAFQYSYELLSNMALGTGA